MTTSSPYPNESEDLEMHVHLCAERYRQLDTRLETLESEVKGIKELLKTSNDTLKTTIISTGGAVIAALVAVLGTILTQNL